MAAFGETIVLNEMPSLRGVHLKKSMHFEMSTDAWNIGITQNLVDKLDNSVVPTDACPIHKMSKRFALSGVGVRSGRGIHVYNMLQNTFNRFSRNRSLSLSNRKGANHTQRLQKLTECRSKIVRDSFIIAFNPDQIHGKIAP